MATAADEAERIELKLDLIRQTEAAYLVSDGDTSVWLPKVQASYDGECFYMPQWLALEKGLV